MVETSDYSDSCSFYSEESWGEESELSSELRSESLQNIQVGGKKQVQCI